MELYKELTKLRCFTRQELIRLTGSESSAEWRIKDYLKRGYIERIRRDLYAVISMETEQPIANRFHIASKTTEKSFVSYHSAFEYYGYANQVFNEVYFSVGKRVRPFYFDGISYCPIVNDKDVGIIETDIGVRISSLERTVIDGIERFEKIGGLEELLRCIALIPSLDADKLLEALDAYGFGQLYQKTGYILEFFCNELSLPESFFSTCEKRSSASKMYLCERQEDFILYPRWRLFAPKDLNTLINKGVSDYVTI